jgi:N-acetyltransferase
MSWINSETTLIGQQISLVPLKLEHRDELLNSANAEGLNQLWFTDIPNETSINAYIQTAINSTAAGESFAFSVLHKATGSIIGSTRFCHIDKANRRLEIGYTWYAKKHQKTLVNTEAKALLLKFAFEDLNCIAVEFRTHWMNHNSRNAILRLGAKQDGVLRSHKILSDGSIRDTVVFSIIAVEWPNVEQNLKFKLSQNDI